MSAHLIGLGHLVWGTLPPSPLPFPKPLATVAPNFGKKAVWENCLSNEEETWRASISRSSVDSCLSWLARTPSYANMMGRTDTFRTLARFQRAILRLIAHSLQELAVSAE